MEVKGGEAGIETRLRRDIPSAQSQEEQEALKDAQAPAEGLCLKWNRKVSGDAERDHDFVLP